MSVLEKSTFAKMFEAAELCRQRALDVPMLVLIYTAIDTLAWAVYSDKSSGVRDRFTSLCDRFILPGANLQCSALELYAARCSVLHSLGWESDLSKAGKARSVFYSFGTDDPTTAQAALDLTSPGKFISVKADDLFAAVRKATAAVAAAASADSDLAARLSVAAGKQYRSLESSAGDEMFKTFIQSVEGDASA
jgi:hypothetical protein